MDDIQPQSMTMAPPTERTFDYGKSPAPVAPTALRRTHANTASDDHTATKRPKSSSISTDPDMALKDKLVAVWSNVVDEESESKAFTETVDAFSGEVESLIRAGLEAYQRWENGQREIMLLKEELAAKNAEIERLRSTDESRRATMQNLLQAAEAAKTDAHSISCNALVAASLRADLSATSSKLDIALSQNEEYKRKNALLEEENYRVTSKLRQVIQEKIKLERDQRMSMSLTKYLENSASTDADFYKRQAAELTSRLQMSQSVIDKKNRQIKALQQQIDHKANQGRLNDQHAD